MVDAPMDDAPSSRILSAWVKLETALRGALPACSVAPPNQPSELLSALRINRAIGLEQEELIADLREIRNRVAHDPQEPAEDQAARFEAAVEGLVEALGSPPAKGPASDS